MNWSNPQIFATTIRLALSLTTLGRKNKETINSLDHAKLQEEDNRQNV